MCVYSIWIKNKTWPKPIQCIPMHGYSTGAEAFTCCNIEAALPFRATGTRLPLCSSAPIQPTSHTALSSNEATAMGHWNYLASRAITVTLSLILGDAVWVSFIIHKLLSPCLVQKFSMLMTHTVHENYQEKGVLRVSI